MRLTRSNIKAILSDLDVMPSKRRGQNFLCDDGVADSIVDYASVSPEEGVLEIGPGLGALTRSLVAVTSKFAVVEVDRRFCEYLGNHIEGLTPGRIIAEDIRKIEASTIAELLGVEQMHVVSNVPYSISSDIIFWILRNRDVISHASLMFQKEFARRIAAKPGGRDYGILSVLTELYASADAGFVVPGDAFHPRAEVDSLVLRLSIRKEPLVEVKDEALFNKVVKGAFGQRRKTLLNSLSAAKLLENKEEVKEALNSVEIDPSRRAETLALREFAALAEEIRRLKTLSS